MAIPLPTPLPTRLRIRATPNARETRITSFENGVLHVDIAAPAEDNKANIELLKFLRRLTKKDVRLVSGATSKNKVVAFEDNTG
jgi:uncharacterized protein (TIGR00251 family)